MWNKPDVKTCLLITIKFQDKSEAKDSDDKESAEEAKDEQEDTVTEQSGLEEIVAVAGSKKDPLVRRQELLVKSGLAEVCLSLTLVFLNIFLF